MAAFPDGVKGQSGKEGVFFPSVGWAMPRSRRRYFRPHLAPARRRETVMPENEDAPAKAELDAVIMRTANRLLVANAGQLRLRGGGERRVQRTRAADPAHRHYCRTEVSRFQVIAFSRNCVQGIHLWSRQDEHPAGRDRANPFRVIVQVLELTALEGLRLEPTTLRLIINSKPGCSRLVLQTLMLTRAENGFLVSSQ